MDLDVDDEDALEMVAALILERVSVMEESDPLSSFNEGKS
jgi:hypothetical protein